MGMDITLVKYNDKFKPKMKPMSTPTLRYFSTNDLRKLKKQLNSDKDLLKKNTFKIEFKDGEVINLDEYQTSLFIIDRITWNLKKEGPDYHKDNSYLYDNWELTTALEMMFDNMFSDISSEKGNGVKLNGVVYSDIGDMISKNSYEMLGYMNEVINDYCYEVLDTKNTDRGDNECIMSFVNYQFDKNLLTQEELSFANFEENIMWATSNDPWIYHNHILITKYKIIKRLDLDMLKTKMYGWKDLEEFLKYMSGVGRDMMCG